MNLLKKFKEKMIQKQKLIFNKSSDELAIELKQNGFTNKKIFDAIKKVPRELFVSERFVEFSYENMPLPIACKQTISQPYVVAFMINCLKLKNTDKVLEIGTGTGYQTALIANLCMHVCTIEIFSELYNQAKINHEKLKLTNISHMLGNGVNGWKENVPFDAIIISAATESLPIKLLKNLKNGGKLIFPKKYSFSVQKLMLVEKISKIKCKYKKLFHVRFVPLLETNTLGTTI